MVAYRAIPAQRVWWGAGDGGVHGMKACPRCGVRRKVHGPRKKKDGTATNLLPTCKDCWYSMSPKEREAWQDSSTEKH